MASLPDSKYIHARESTDIENEAGPSNSEALRRPSGGLHRGLSARQASMIAIGGAIGTGNAFSALFSESFISTVMYRLIPGNGTFSCSRRTSFNPHHVLDYRICRICNPSTVR